MVVRDPKTRKWINSNVFREEALKFESVGYYCNAPQGTPDWFAYWQEQLRRCIEGYSVFDSKGVEHKITGHHYMYLNFTQIQVVVEDKDDEGSQVAEKLSRHPDFWDGDYDYFWSLEIARNGLFTSKTLVPSTEEEKKEYRKYQKQIRELKKELGIKDYKKSSQYKEIKEKRDKVSQKVLDRLGLRVKPHLDYVNGGYHMIVGKEQPNSCIVKTPFGDKEIGNLKPGDIIYNSYGSMSKVLSVNPQGLKDVYEITLFDGRKTRCGLEHLWEIFGPIHRKGKRKHETVSLKELLERPLKVGSKYKAFIKLSEPVEHLETYLPIPPYTMGALLGDGNVTKQLKLSGSDEEVLNNVLTELNMFFDLGEYYVSSKHGYNWNLRYRPFNKTSKKGNPIYEELKEFGLNCKSENKYIPQIYKESSIAQRIELVKGLMDTDGFISEDGAMTFGNKSEKLVKDLQEILYSLGIQATYRLRKDGIHILYINSDINLFGITRKKERFIPTRKVRKFVPIVEIKKLDYQEESTCILVDSDDHTYLTDSYIVTHNSRRKGYSYKNGAICANVYNTVRNAQIIIGAFEKKFLYPQGTMGMASNYLNYLNEHTGWAKSRDYVDKQDHKEASYKTVINGVPVKQGYKSEIMALTFKDNPDAARGKDAVIVLLEEAGAFPILKEAYNAIYPALTGGSYITGQIIIFGTGGDMESGTVQYADMFYHPEAYRLMPFMNIWDDDAENTVCGFFHPVTWNMEGFYDDQGNSDIEAATEFEMERRANLLATSSSSSTLQQHVQEYPFKPSEAFLTVSTNNFPVVELRNQLNKVKTEGLQTKKGTPVILTRENGKVVAKPDLKGLLTPIYDYKPKVKDLTGAPIIYEYPIDNPPKGLYKIGYDPYRQDLSSGVSLAAIYVYKATYSSSHTNNIIVAEYVGRPQEADDVNRIAQYFAELYNAEIMHENEVTHVINYFRRIKKLNLLAAQPDAVISKNIKNSTVARVYGIHMVEVLKDAGEKYIKDWLLTVRDYDENNNPILNLETINSIGLLEELIQYNRKGNFDRVMAFMMCMFQIQEDEIGKDYAKDTDSEKMKDILRVLDNFFGR